MSMYQVNLYHCSFSIIPLYSMHPVNVSRYKTVYFSKMVGALRPDFYLMRSHIGIVYKLFLTLLYIADELWELVQLSGAPINREVSKIVSLVTVIWC